VGWRARAPATHGDWKPGQEQEARIQSAQVKNHETQKNEPTKVSDMCDVRVSTQQGVDPDSRTHTKWVAQRASGSAELPMEREGDTLKTAK